MVQSLNPPNALLIDLDDTIIAFEVLTKETWRKAARLFSGEINSVDPEILATAVLDHSKSFWADPDRHRRWRQDLDAARRKIVELAFADLGINDLELAESFARLYSKMKWESLYVFPGSIETIDAAREHGIITALITNGSSESQRSKLERFSLAGHFDHIFIEGERGFGKPDPRIYKLALSELQVSAEETWMVGDNIVWDVLAPQELGIMGIWIRNRHVVDSRGYSGCPFLTIDSLSELTKYLE
ncbi:MAG: HAD family hydrolase [Thermoplasmataceae archaeon]